ncbi:EF-P beta-lysylation protein EpmB [Candidatus Venteria ishoeyi]|uniref:EF-P beta-lysylation protein EpmB n=1 Tax=Candidatus Venteria ishoeyi TaxID=1899563 RepID=UPI0025A5E513|nr:EF-P beta-lysylation protein EpmB [Candidatus Venteria ishoeyi]MDM8544855.1 EF-P beta-lysylation protein EpmB [Candidatus Venteria ishoeyi]
MDILLPSQASSGLSHNNASASWQRSLQQAIRNPETLLEHLGLSATQLPIDIANTFSLKVPLEYVAKMRQSDPTDPLLRQVLPLDEENNRAAGFNTDPVGDLNARQSPALLQKYQHRMLVLVTGACALHCRYCFRRCYPYGETGHAEMQQQLTQIRAQKQIHEVILSGGDPLLLSDPHLTAWIQALSAIKHVQRLRIHTRLPVVLASRITDALLSSLQESRLQVFMVIHSNHANELDETSANALQQLRQADCTLLNQTVLLKGVNDQAETQIALHTRLGELQVLPYYLHLLDRVQGAAHFEVAESRALSLMKAMREALPGYLVPRLVREEAGKAYKTPVY